ncbi:MAG: AAA family ATPase [Magnetococcales bacterium]|nr:AAA family ATPase [Magnetococcales bacterium]
MFTELYLGKFKNFVDATLKMGPLTVLIGPNASGKSNVRDLFRFLLGNFRGCTFEENVFGKWGEGGNLEWPGVRGQLSDYEEATCRFITNDNEVSSDFLKGILKSPLPKYFAFMRFLDLSPDALRRPSAPGLSVLGDRGENLSSALQAICADEKDKAALLSWLRELTPMAVTDLIFREYADGLIQLAIVEENGRITSAGSASDGTLRLLGLLALILGPKVPKFLFIEEVENGFHPQGLRLVVDLLQRLAPSRGCQVVVTTHNPYLLSLLSAQTLETTSLIYRLPGEEEGRIVPVLEIPHLRQALEHQDLGQLLTGNWMEITLEFARGEV